MAGESTRRQFLAGAAVAAGWLTACGDEVPETRSTASTKLQRATTTAPQPTTTTAARVRDLGELAQSMSGTLLRPGDADFESARLLFSRAYDDIVPTAVARCISEADVQACVDYARATRSAMAVRSGGHSLAGFSTTTGLVIDLGTLARVEADAASGRARVGAGTQLIDVYDTMAAQGVAIPGGSCATVGIGGLALGGGVGVTTRAFGLTCDRLVGATVVLADGLVVEASDRANSDLFWALRGAGGGSFGVVTSLEFETVPVPQLGLAFVRWGWGDPGRVVDAWQAWIAAAPDDTWSVVALRVGGGSTPIISSAIVTVDRDARPAAEELARQAGTPESLSSGMHGYVDAALIEAGCSDEGPADCHRADRVSGGTIGREAFLVRSDIVQEPLPAEAIATVADWIARRQTMGLGTGAFQIDALGGVVDRLAVDATAWAHRGALGIAQYSAGFEPTDSESRVANTNWIDGFYAVMRPFAGGGAYVNYPDPTLADAVAAYFGPNAERLRAVKRAYDPDNVFTFAQAITA